MIPQVVTFIEFIDSFVKISWKHKINFQQIESFQSHVNYEKTIPSQKLYLIKTFNLLKITNHANF